MSVDTKGSNTDVQQDEDWEPLPYLPPSTPTRKQPKSRFEMDGIETHDIDAVTTQMSATLDEWGGSEAESTGSEGATSHSDEESGIDDQEPHHSDMDSSPGSLEDGANAMETGPDTWIWDQFKEYCDHAHRNFAKFSKDEVEAIRLLHLLKRRMPHSMHMTQLCFGT